MIRVTLIALGKLKEKYLREAIEEYSKRLSRYCDLKVLELNPVSLPENPSSKQTEDALKREAELILSKIPERAYKIALCVEGKSFSSEAFSSLVSEKKSQGLELCLIIGSSYGLCESLKQAADLRLSLSDMTFPHQLFRVMLLEQLYRAFKIEEGSAYHK